MSALGERRRLSEVTIGGGLGRGLAAGLLIAAMAVGAAGATARVVAIGLAGVGLLITGRRVVPRALSALGRRRSLWLVVILAGLLLWWVIAGLERVGHPYSYGAPNGYLLNAYEGEHRAFFLVTGWPWRIGQTPLFVPIFTLLAAAGGLVLIADAVRVRVGFGTLGASPWRVLTARRSRSAQVISRAVPGVALVLVAAALAVSYSRSYTGATFQVVSTLFIGLWAAVMIAAPPIIGAWLVLDRDKAGRAREEERLRFAAHLHDSVLQTLALIQRQSQDPAAVSRLARRQEHALRAWMAGQSDLASATLASALREVVDEVEDERALTVELTVLGDHRLEPSGEALVAAVREALRNAAAHAPGAAVTVFAQFGEAASEVFVRDAGPGFDISEVANERRGIRDAIIGRMASVGGQAIVESEPGQGTEVILRLG